MTINTYEPKKYAKTVDDLIQGRPYVKFSVNDTLPDILKRLGTFKGGSGAVVETSGKLIGLITEREIIRRVLDIPIKANDEVYGFSVKEKDSKLTAWQLMIANPDTLHLSDSIENALDVITYYGYRHMPVVDYKGRCLGIVDAREIHAHIEMKTEDIIDSKDALLSYFMHSEPYGRGAAI